MYLSPLPSISASILQMDELVVFVYHTAALYVAMQWSSCSGIDRFSADRSSSCAPLVLDSDLLLALVGIDTLYKIVPLLYHQT